MRLRLRCPFCETRNVEATRKVWFLHGIVIAARYGKRTFIGCPRCLNREVWKNLVTCTLVGWWCFPWGIGTPIVILQNLFVAAFHGSESSHRRALERILRDVGLNLADLEVGADGLTRDERDAMSHLCQILHDAMHVDGKIHKAETALGIQILRSAFPDTLASGRAAEMLTTPPKPVGPIEDLTFDWRVTLLECALMIVGADGLLTGPEMEFIRILGGRLAIPPGIVQSVVNRVLFGAASETADPNEPEECRAARVALGVGPNATRAEIRRRYQEQIARNHPDVAARYGLNPKQATTIAQELNWAYAVLNKRSA
jgi:DnaJ-domain-containing protein 1